MDTFTAIHTRRSIRRYADRPVPDALVKRVLRAAMAAPSACNQQPWEFVIIDNLDMVREIANANPAALALETAPMAIAVCGNLKRELPLAKDFWVQDCSAAIQNLLLAAWAGGLGTVWLGGYPLPHLVEMVKDVLELPDHVIPLAVVALGYPAEDKQPVDRFDPVRIHRNRWQGIWKQGGRK
jgi:nitroreductase